jgi:S-DNA-T family DNA segregation ATPase FtsK/SpoIIIE
MAATKKWRTKKERPPKKKAQDPPGRTFPRWVREGLGIALLGTAAFLFLALFSYCPETDPGFFQSISPQPKEVKNLGGPVGAYGASLLKETLGLGSYFVVALLAWMAVPVIRGRSLRMAPWKIPVGLFALVWVSTLISLAMPDRPSANQGGIVGQQMAEWLLEALHPVGSYLLIIVVLILSVAALGEVAFLASLKSIGTFLLRAGRALYGACVKGAGHCLQLSRQFLAKAGERAVALRTSVGTRISEWRSRRKATPEAEQPEPEKKAAPEIVNHKFKPPAPAAMEKPSTPAPEQGAPATEGVSPKIVDPEKGEHPLATDSEALTGEEGPKKPVQSTLPFPQPLPEGYRHPPLDLLDDPDPEQSVVDEEGLKESAEILVSKLKDFGVNGRVTEIHPGPIITLFEYEPASGIKVNRIVNLADDLALAMKALSIRIVAPIPGKSVVGIEVPNRKRQVVTLKEILGDKAFQECRWKIPLALGKDIAGKPVTTDLARMPHLLMAGATGTGKSVNLHSLILSILFRFSPQEVKFLMIDPKMLELAGYHGVPHLLHPVITDSRRASDVLDWAVERMEQRYQLLSEKGVRNIESYNEKIEKELAASGGVEAEPLPEIDDLDEEDGAIVPERGKLPYIILVIDEMADLMIVAGRQIEESITRLAQMARAAGIHLLLATQRPSVDVLTGIIKANLPARISFQVSSRTDSRTILDNMGAEKLLGRGDMLFLPPGTSKVTRIHGPYVSEPEIERVVDYIKQHGRPQYEKIPFKSKKAKDGEESFEHDEKYDEAVQLVAETRQASISMIQRKLRVGYNRAARMIERMEQEGVVGPQEGVKPREVLVNNLE